MRCNDFLQAFQGILAPVLQKLRTVERAIWKGKTPRKIDIFVLHIALICSAKLTQFLHLTILPLPCDVRCASSGRTSTMPVGAGGCRWRS